MADLPPDAGTGNSVRPTADRPPGTPRWVKVFGIAAIFVVLLIAIMLLTGHGPGRHSGDAGSHVARSSVMEAFARPEGGG
jgi:hypothetical protein